jgi:hypothetical protein
MTTQAIPLPPAASASSAAGFALDGADTPYTALVALVDGEEALLLWRGDAPPQTVKLRPLGVPIAVTNGVALQRATSGHLWACVVSMVPGDAGRRQPWLLDLTALGVAPVAGTQDGPVTPPAPPGGAGDPTPVLQAIAAARGPLDGKDAPDNSIAGVKNTGNAIYDRLGIKPGEPTVEAWLRQVATLAGDAAEGAGYWMRPATNDAGLPPELARFLGTQAQRDLAFWLITMLEFLLRLPEFPRADGGTILRT